MTSSTSVRPPRRDATENRAAILESARSILNRDPDASLEAIAIGAGLSRRAIYGHFSTRDDLIETMQALGTQRIVAALALIGHPDSRIAIALIGARLWSEVEHVRVTAQSAVRGPQRETVASALEPVRTMLHAVVERGIESGELRVDISAPTLARLIEGSALSVLDEAVRSGLSRAEGHRLVMLAGLGAAGLSWREAGSVIDGTPELQLDAGTGTGTGTEIDAVPRTDTDTDGGAQ